MTKTIYIDAGRLAGEFADWLEKRGYRYGYSGKPCMRRAAHNMPFVTIDIEKGFYSGSKSADTSVTWHKLNNTLWEFLIMRIPDIEEIHDCARKSDGVPRDGNMRVESKDGRKMERVWYTANGRAMGISRMDDDHLHNTILKVDREIFYGGDTIGMNADLENLLNELEDERIHRGLHLPLVPLISLEYRKGNI